MAQHCLNSSRTICFSFSTVTEQRSVADTPKENLQPNLFLCCDSSDCTLLSILPLFFSFIWHQNTAFASAIELTCEGSLIYVNLWLLVCQVADQSQFTVGVEGGLWELSCLFQVDLARMHGSANPLCGCLHRSVNMLRANRWCSVKWWLGLFVGFSLCAPPPSHSETEMFCLGQLMCMQAKAEQLFSLLCSCVCV